MKKILITLLVLCVGLIAVAEEPLAIYFDQITIPTNASAVATGKLTNTIPSSGLFEVESIFIDVSYASGDGKTSTVVIATGDASSDASKETILTVSAVTQDGKYKPREFQFVNNANASINTNSVIERIVLFKDNIEAWAYNSSNTNGTDTVDITVNLIEK